MKKKEKGISPLYLSLLHLLPSLLLLILILVGFLSLSYSDKHRAVLGLQAGEPQVRTETVEDRIRELTEVGKTTDSEALENAKADLFR